ncbi:hypothetical protein [Streptomyces afghaniensis]|uniref:hypothetical protein n=1 Tax=Streptomyces afghaniensis TaxID=66865 RepID=UPI0037B6A65F
MRPALTVLTALLLAVLPTAIAPAAQAAPAADTMPLAEAVAHLPVAAEDRTGYDREQSFGDWIDADRDGCNTRIICTTGPGWSTTSLVRGDSTVLTDLRYMRHWGRLRSS